MQNEITLLAKDIWIWAEETLSLQDKFLPFLEKAKIWELEAKAILVTDISQKEVMQQAREMRLEIRAFRVNVENTRKELKEESLRKWQAIDRVSNIIKAIIEPIEEYLELQEKFAAIQEEKRVAELKAQRLELLAPYEISVEFVKVEEMTDEQFATFTEEAKTSYDLKLANIERLRLEAIETKEREAKLKEDNDRLQMANDLQAKEIQRQREDADRVAKETADAEAKIQKDKADADAKAKADQDAKDKLALDTQYKEFLNSHWCNIDTKADYTTKTSEDWTVTLYKKVAEYKPCSSIDSVCWF